MSIKKHVPICADCYITHQQSVHICEYFLYKNVSKSAEKCTKYGQNFNCTLQ